MLLVYISGLKDVIIKIKEFPRRRVRLRVSWNDIPDLIKQIYEEAKVKILRKTILDTLFKTGVNWRRCLDYLEVKHSLDTTDPLIEEIRQAFIQLCLDEGHQDIAKRIGAE